MQQQRERYPDDSMRWIGQSISGVLLIVLLAIHMIAQHYMVEGGLRDYEQVMVWLRSPWVLAMEIIFLGVVTYHALLGARSIAYDFGLPLAVQKNVNRILLAIGVVTFGYGLWLILTIYQQALQF
ncbi:MAG: hypothetical protein GYB64_05245 [Chloroflexi bacterium]|nr:hypothetical protein [Chloroflexota bacterium]